MKIFQGGEEKRLIAELKKSFAQARGFKPEACRAESFETYLVATGFKALAGARRATDPSSS
jgi:23S rRNA (uridine2552-2'-O)-methyltransferase